MNSEEIGKDVDTMIALEDLPPRASLKPVGKFDGLLPEEPDEIEAYYDFIRFIFAREHQVLQCVPRPKQTTDFWNKDLDEFGIDQSAFNTWDFQRMHKFRFNKYHWKIKKIYEKVKDLAITYSVLSDENAKRNVHQKFRTLVECEFQDTAKMLRDHLVKYPKIINRKKCIERITELNYRIKKCNEIWEEYSGWE